MTTPTPHRCDNCDGIDPASCISAPTPDRTPTGDLRERLVCALKSYDTDIDRRAADAVLPVVEAETAALRDRAEQAEELLRELLDIRPCDMRGRWCQAHLEKAPCPQGEAQRYLVALDQPEGT